MKKILFLMLLLSSVQTWCAEQSEEKTSGETKRLGLLIERSCPSDWEAAVTRVTSERKVDDELVKTLTDSVYDLFVERNADKLDDALKLARIVLQDNKDLFKGSGAELKKAMLSADADEARRWTERASDALHLALSRKEVEILEGLIEQ